jgi:hypothetical protein
MVSLRSALQAINCNVEGINPQEDDPTICPACHRRFKAAGGVQCHLRTAKSCSWYKMGKLKALSMPGQFEEVVMSQDWVEVLPEELALSEDEMEAGDLMDQFHEELYELIPGADWNAPGPSRYPSPSAIDRYLVPSAHRAAENEDARVVIQHPTAGHVIRMVPTLHEKWKKQFGGDMEGEDQDQDVDMDAPEGGAGAKFAPFASELDWRIANWAIRDGIGHKSFDRLMSIPGVSDAHCLIYYCH